MTINANEGEYKSRIGLDSMYVAEVTVDSDAAYTADTPEYFAPAATATQAPASGQDTQYADNQAYDVITAEGATALSLEITGIPLEMLAKILGKQFDATTGRLYDNGGTPPDIALSYRSLKSDGKYRYYQFLKGKFSPPNEDSATKTATPAPKTQTLTYTAIRTKYKFNCGGGVTDSVKRVVGDEDTDNFSATDWFSQVQTPAAVTPSALSLDTADPQDNASGVAQNKTITLTFNNALPADAINNVVVTAADGTLKATTNSLDVTKKIMTVNPDTNLGDTIVYIVAIGVTDIYGSMLKTVVNFTSASA